jgi:hypothetical protein
MFPESGKLWLYLHQRKQASKIVLGYSVPKRCELHSYEKAVRRLTCRVLRERD